MLFTLLPLARPDDRIHLYQVVDDALAVAGADQHVVPVAVHFDATCRRLFPEARRDRRFNSAWTVPVVPHPDGSLSVEGPIPDALFVGD